MFFDGFMKILKSYDLDLGTLKQIRLYFNGIFED